MSVSHYDPISAGQISYSNTPYQYWKGHVSDSRYKTIEFSLNNRTFQVEIGRDGNWELQLPLRLEEGSHNLTVRYISHSGNLGQVLQRQIMVDFSPPDKPVITAVLDDAGSVIGPIGPGGFTDDEKPTISGFAEPDSIVRVYSNGELIGSVQAAKNGSWQLDAPLGKGLHNVYVTASDKYNQTSEPSDTYPLRINVPLVDQPVLLSVTDNEGRKQGAIAHNGQTDDKTPQLSGAAPPDAVQVNIYINGQFVVGLPVHDGKWSWTSGYPILKDGNNVITLRAQNIRGELSDETQPFNVIVAPDPVEKPQILKVVDDFGNVKGDVTHGGTTDDKTPTLKGKGIPGTIVEVEFGQSAQGWNSAGSVMVDASGNWTLESPLLAKDGSWDYRARTIQGEGKSEWTGAFTLKVTPYADVLTIDSAADNFGPVTGALKDGALTDDFTPILKGKAAADALVYLYATVVGGKWVSIGSVMTDSKGDWSFESRKLGGGNGEYHFQASYTATRNVTAPVFKLHIQADADKVPEITHAADDVGTIKGDVKQGGITDDKTPTLHGKGVPGAIIEVIYGLSTDGWSAAGSTVVDANGNWTLTSPLLTKDGIWEYRARTVNGANKSAYTAKFIFNLDTTAPDLPVITSAYDNNGELELIATKGLTTDKTPELRGTGEPNTKLILVLAFNSQGWENGNKTYEVMTDAKGNWSIKIPDALAEGRWHFRAKSVDAAGNTTDLSQQYYFDVVPAPAAPEIIHASDDAGEVKGDVKNGGITDDKTPTLQGKGVPGTIIEVNYGLSTHGWSSAGTVVVDEKGNWTLTSPQLGSDGIWEYRARTLSGGVKSEWTKTFTLKVTPYADAPKIESAADNFGEITGTLKDGDLTDDFTPILKGKAAASTLIYLYATVVGGQWNPIGSVMTDSNGNWSFESRKLVGGNGEYHFQASYTATQNSAAPLFKLNVYAEADKAPEITHAVDDVGSVKEGVKNGGTTDDKTPVLQGKGIPGAIIEVIYGLSTDGWSSAGSAKVDANGNWSLASPLLAKDGIWEYRARSVFGSKVSPYTEKFIFSLDTTAPAVPVITGAYDNDGELKSIADKSWTTDKTPELRGTAEPNSKLILVLALDSQGWENGNKTYEVMTDAKGNWTVKIPDALAEGLWHFRAKAVDAAGNTTALSPQYYFSVVTVPATPEITHAEDNVGAVKGDVKDGGLTDDKTPTLQGKGKPGSIIEINYGLSTEGWSSAGFVVVDANGNWTLTSPQLAKDGVWEYRARTVNGEVKSEWTKTFTLKVTPYTEAPKIEGAADNFGTVTGSLKDGALTDDFTPTLTGKAAGSTLIYLYAKVASGHWVSIGSVMTDSKGDWSFESRKLVGGNGEYHFQASYTATRNSDAPLFKLNIHADADKTPEITHAVDDAGTATGNVKHFGITDDRTPTLHGKGVPGAVIEVIYGLSTDAWSSAGSTIVDANGNWTLTSPQLNKDGVWEYRARSGNGASKSAYTEKFILNVVTGADEKKGYQWDFSDGTLQGWTAAGKYAKNGDLEVKSWSGKSGAKELGSWTNDGTTSGYNGDVVYRYMAVEKGQIYEVSFDTWRSFNDSVGFPRLGMHIDGQPVIPQDTHNSGWKHSTGYYVATETKVVKVAITNGTATGVGNDFAIDNIAIKPLANSGSELFDLNPNGTGAAFDFALNTQYTLKSGLRLKMQKAATDDMKVSMYDGYAEFNRGSETRLTFTTPTSAAKMHMGFVHKPGSKVNFYDTEGKLLYTKDLPHNGSAQNDFTFEYKAPSGKLIGSALVVVAPGETTITGAPGGVRLYDMDWQKPAATSSLGMMSFGEDPVTLTGDEAHIELSALLSQQNVQGRVDLSGNGSNTLSVDVASLLQHGETSLFIDDGKTQMLIKGDSNDTIKLSDILPSGEKEGSWNQQTGQITVGGVAYNVYSHSGADAELLVQQGVKTELV